MGVLDNTVVVVTGAAGGLGRAMSGGLIAAGARVVGADLPGGPANTPMVSDDLMWPDRSKPVQPPQMIAPVVWLASKESDGVNGMRFIAQMWNGSLSTAAAASIAGAPAGF